MTEAFVGSGLGGSEDFGEDLMYVWRQTSKRRKQVLGNDVWLASLKLNQSCKGFCIQAMVHEVSYF